MIIKGSARGQSPADTANLARHLLAKENEYVEVMQIQGVTTDTLPNALAEMRLVTLGTRARRGLYHAGISLDREEAPGMSRARWIEAADELERRLGMQGHQRAVVLHVKRGREHVHIVWCRVHSTTFRLARDSQNYKRHEETSRCLEARWGLRQVTGVHTRPKGMPRPVAVGTHDDWQAQERTGISVIDAAAALQEAWAATTTGKDFAAAIDKEGFRLARGRRGIVVVDEAGTPHSLPRRLQRRAADVRRRLTDVDEATLPTVEDLKAATRRQDRRNTVNTKNISTQTFGISDGQPRRGQSPMNRRLQAIEFWQALGFQFEETDQALVVFLPGGGSIHDHGDEIMLVRSGEPTDEEIRLLVTAAKARGWERIRFFGGSPEVQRRARIEALRHGYRLDQISLECEDGTPQPMSAVPMPSHIRRRLTPDDPAPAAPPPPEPTTPSPTAVQP